MTTGELIQNARKKAGLSQRQLGERLGVSASMIGQWENNFRNPKRETLRKLANALRVTIPYFDGMDDINALDIEGALKRGDRSTAEKLMGLSPGALEPPDPGYSHSDIERDLIFVFSNLNDEGQKEAYKRVSELFELSRYRRPDAPHLDNIADIDMHTPDSSQGPLEDE